MLLFETMCIDLVRPLPALENNHECKLPPQSSDPKQTHQTANDLPAGSGI